MPTHIISDCFLNPAHPVSLVVTTVVILIACAFAA
jgi:hypothetical protein